MTQLHDSVSLAQQLVQIDSTNPGSNEIACVELLSGILQKAGFTVTIKSFEKDRPSIIARRGESSKPSLCFAGHIDTVPFGQRDWTSSPLSGEIKDGRLHGRGSCDMKGGIAAMVVAACNLVSSLKDEDDLILIIAAGEESGCQGSQYLAEQKDLLGNAGALIVTEPSDNYPLIGHKGAFWLSAKFEGKTAHGSMPETGDNAVYKATRAVEKIKDFDFSVTPHPFLGMPSLNVGYFHGGLNINSVPDIAEVGIDIRTMPDVDHDLLKEKIQESLGADAVISTIINVPPLWTDPETDWVQDVYDIAEPVIGEKPTTKTVAFFTDGAPLHLAYDNIPTVVLGPGSSAMAHQTDEFCPVQDIVDATNIYERIIKKWYDLAG